MLTKVFCSSPVVYTATRSTCADAVRLFGTVDRPNLMIKVPATPAGIPAIRTLIGQGVGEGGADVAADPGVAAGRSQQRARQGGDGALAVGACNCDNRRINFMRKQIDITANLHPAITRLLQGRGDETVGSIRREMLAVPETFPIREMFDRFLQTREHIALIVDEFGGMAGIVTMEDLVETLLGTEIIPRPHDDLIGFVV